MIRVSTQELEDFHNRPDVFNPTRSSAIYETFTRTRELLDFVAGFERGQCAPVSLDMGVLSIGCGIEGWIISLIDRHYVNRRIESVRAEFIRPDSKKNIYTINLNVYVPTEARPAVQELPRPGDRLYVTKAVGLTVNHDRRTFTAYANFTQTISNY